MTDNREAFEAWYDAQPDGRIQPWDVWQAATAAERERCANVCEAFANERFALYKGRPPYTGKEPGRFSEYVQGQADGADQCADAIRKGE